MRELPMGALGCDEFCDGGDGIHRGEMSGGDDSVEE